MLSDGDTVNVGIVVGFVEVSVVAAFCFCV
jgi:hypothetical protein